MDNTTPIHPVAAAPDPGEVAGLAFELLSPLDYVERPARVRLDLLPEGVRVRAWQCTDGSGWFDSRVLDFATRSESVAWFRALAAALAGRVELQVGPAAIV